MPGASDDAPGIGIHLLRGAIEPSVTLKDTMVRVGHSSERAALMYQHSDLER